MTDPRPAPRIAFVPAPDEEITVMQLADEGFDTVACTDLHTLCAELQDGAGVAVLTEESLQGDGARRLSSLLANQPLWSDIPVLLLTQANHPPAASAYALFGNVTVLERPVQLVTLEHALRWAIRARTWQLELRDRLRAREQVERPTRRESPSNPPLVAVGDGVQLGSWESDGSGRFVHIARAFLDVLGRELPDALQRGWSDLVHPDERARFLGAWPRLFAKAVTFDHEYRIRAEGGAYRTVLMRGMPLLDDAGVVTAWIGIHLDITARRNAERELERVDRLESVSHVASGIAHEFNNLLTGVLGNIALARMTAHRDEETLRRLHDAERAGKQAQELARQLLEFARGTAPVLAPLWIPSILREATEFALQGLAVRCAFHLAEDLPGVQANAAELGQAVQNLILNRVHALGGEGMLVMRAAAIQVGAGGSLALEPGPYVMVSITGGKELSAEELQRVFEFPPGARDRSAVALPIAYAIIRRHGGHLVAASHPEGSTFTFYLPAGPKITQPSAVAPFPEPNVVTLPPRGRGRLLVMDDDAQVRAVAYLSLVRLGYQVTLAMHGFQAIQNYRTAMQERQPYRTVFLDLTVQGGMGGRETLQRLQEIDPEVRAIAVTGYTDDPLLTTYAEHGFAGAITKPYTVDDLGRVLQAVVSPARPNGQHSPLA